LVVMQDPSVMLCRVGVVSLAHIAVNLNLTHMSKSETGLIYFCPHSFAINTGAKRCSVLPHSARKHALCDISPWV